MSDDGVALPYLDPLADAWLLRWPAPRKALFLDRDGVINADHGYVHAPGQTQWIPGIFELVRDALAAGWLPIVVTNQAGIARGLYDEATFLAYTAWMHAQFRQREAPLLATYYCPHHARAGRGDYLRDCVCRKPQPGMIRAATARFSIDLAASVLIGDKPGDIAAANAAGVTRTALVSAQQARPLAGLQGLFAP